MCTRFRAVQIEWETQLSVDQFDVAVIGGGHNALVAATYLARRDLRVVVLEQRPNLGGACATEALFPGYRVSTCSYQLHMFQDTVMRDLGLLERGLRIVPIDPILHLFPDHSLIRAWRDRESTMAEIAAIEPSDVDGYRKWSSFWSAAGGIFARYSLVPEPPSLSELPSQVSEDEQAVLERLCTGSVRELVEECFVNEKVKAFALLGIGPISTSLDTPGSLLSAAAQEAGRHGSGDYKGLPVGGMGAVADAIASAARAAGVTIETDARVTRIVTREGRAAGVELADGRTFWSRAVVSNATPGVTFDRLLDPFGPERSLVDPALARVENTFHGMKFHVAVNELPDLRAWLGPDPDVRQLANFRLSPSVDHFAAMLRDVAAGRIAEDPVVHVQIPSVLDPSVAPPGQHLVSMWVRFAPRKPPFGSWADVRDAEAKRLIDLLTRYAPNFERSIAAFELFTPDDLEARIGMTAGNIHHIDHRAGQLLGDRLFPGGGHRTPVPGLYMCGAGTHPGGEVTGAPGHNAAELILADMG